MVKLTKEEGLQLVNEVFVRPLLWDVSDKLYRRTDKKVKAWEDISDAFGRKYKSQELAAIFKGLKDTFMANLRRVRDTTSSGKGTDEVFVPKWYLWNVMQFLRPACAQGASTSNIEAPAPQQVPIDEDEECVDEPTHSPLGSQMLFYYDTELQQTVPIPPDTTILCDEGTSCELQKLIMGITSDPSTSNALTSSSSGPSAVPTSPSPGPSQPSSETPKAGPQLFESRGSAKRKASENVQEMVKVFKDLTNQPLLSEAEVALLKPQQKPTHHYETFGNYIASRLMAMDEEVGKQCEKALMRVMLDF